MPAVRPTKAALAKHPKAVVILSIPSDNLTGEPMGDFEWFDTTEGIDLFIPDAIAWADEQVNAGGDPDLYFVFGIIEDAKADPIVPGKVHVVGKEQVHVDALIQRFTDDPSLFVFPAAVKKPKAATGAKDAAKPKAPAAKAEVKAGRKASPAAAKVEVDTTPAVKGRRVRRPAGGKAEPEGNTVAPQQKAADVKARVAARKAAAAKPAATPEPSTDVDDNALQVEAASA